MISEQLDYLKDMLVKRYGEYLAPYKLKNFLDNYFDPIFNALDKDEEKFETLIEFWSEGCEIGVIDPETGEIGMLRGSYISHTPYRYP